MTCHSHANASLLQECNSCWLDNIVCDQQRCVVSFFQLGVMVVVMAVVVVIILMLS